MGIKRNKPAGCSDIGDLRSDGPRKKSSQIQVSRQVDN